MVPMVGLAVLHGAPLKCHTGHFIPLIFFHSFSTFHSGKIATAICSPIKSRLTITYPIKKDHHRWSFFMAEKAGFSLCGDHTRKTVHRTVVSPFGEHANKFARSLFKSRLFKHEKTDAKIHPFFMAEKAGFEPAPRY